MRKKNLLLVGAVMCVFLFTGCNKKDTNTGTAKSNNENKVVIDVETADTVEVETNNTIQVDEKEMRICDEMELVENKSLEFENSDWDIPQQEMNAKAGEWFVLWDDELNSLWARLKSALSEDEMAPILAEQRAWINRKEKNVIGAGFSAYGGTLRPLLENSKAEEMTRVRTYVLAEYLAKAKGEDYIMPENVSSIMEEVDPSLDSVFEVFSGNYEQNDELVINVCRIEEADFTADQFEEGVKWLMWYTHSDVLTDADVYAYTIDTIIFEKEGIYYALEKGIEGDGKILLVGEDMAFMEMVGELN